MISNNSSTFPVDARGVTKRFGDFVALKDLSLRVQSGQCVGLLGPNGAGKSTFIGCLYGSVDRSGGDLRVFGFDPARDARRIKERIGVVPQENALDEELTVLENMRLYARFQGVKNPLRRIKELLEHMSLEHKSNAQIRSLSGGMKRRLTFVRALLSDPELLILDEPFQGLAPVLAQRYAEALERLRGEDKDITLLITESNPKLIEAFADMKLTIERGEIQQGVEA